MFAKCYFCQKPKDQDELDQCESCHRYACFDCEEDLQAHNCCKSTGFVVEEDEERDTA